MFAGTREVEEFVFILLISILNVVLCVYEISFPNMFIPGSNGARVTKNLKEQMTLYASLGSERTRGMYKLLEIVVRFLELTRGWTFITLKL